MTGYVSFHSNSCVVGSSIAVCNLSSRCIVQGVHERTGACDKPSLRMHSHYHTIMVQAITVTSSLIDMVYVLLCLQSMFTWSKYGAYVFDGTWNAPQPVDVIAYTALHNTTAFHATAVHMNVSEHLYDTVLDFK